MADNEVLAAFEHSLVEGLDYIKSSWTASWGQSFPNYECVHCQFSSIDFKDIAEHIYEGEHPWCFPKDVNGGKHPAYKGGK